MIGGLLSGNDNPRKWNPALKSHYKMQSAPFTCLYIYLTGTFRSALGHLFGFLVQRPYQDGRNSVFKLPAAFPA